MRRRAMELQAWVEEGLGQRWSTMMCTVGKRSTGSGYSPDQTIIGLTKITWKRLIKLASLHLPLTS
ncbi:hypothetical protein HID58_072052, partial [Brassica napus]